MHIAIRTLGLYQLTPIRPMLLSLPNVCIFATTVWPGMKMGLPSVMVPNRPFTPWAPSITPMVHYFSVPGAVNDRYHPPQRPQPALSSPRSTPPVQSEERPAEDNQSQEPRQQASQEETLPPDDDEIFARAPLLNRTTVLNRTPPLLRRAPPAAPRGVPPGPTTGRDSR